MSSKKKPTLPYGALLVINTQEELNEFVEIMEILEKDSLVIDEEYVVYMDEVVYIVPYKEIDESHFLFGAAKIKFNKWRKKWIIK